MILGFDFVGFERIDVWAGLGLCCKWTCERTKLSLLIFIGVGLKFFGNLMDCI